MGEAVRIGSAAVVEHLTEDLRGAPKEERHDTSHAEVLAELKDGPKVRSACHAPGSSSLFSSAAFWNLSVKRVLVALSNQPTYITVLWSEGLLLHRVHIARRTTSFGNFS